jgi:hypothetical protein
MRKIVAAALLAVLATAGCTSAAVTSPAASNGAASTRASSPSATPSAAAAVLATPPSRWGRPPRYVTPGAAGKLLAAICPIVSAALEAGRPSTAVKDKVYAEYGIPPGQRYRYRIDHLVPLELDGKNSIHNLWPQLVRASRVKDRLENTLHMMVCAGQITLASAQRAIRTNWVRAYHRYVRPPTVPSTAPAPPPAPAPSSAASAPAPCYPTTSSGNCYEPGEFCSTADHGMTGVAGNGERIICEDNNGWRWEPA